MHTSKRIVCSTPLSNLTLGFRVERNLVMTPRAPLTRPASASRVLIRMTWAPILSVRSACAGHEERSSASAASSREVSRAEKVHCAPGRPRSSSSLSFWQSALCVKRPASRGI